MNTLLNYLFKGMLALTLVSGSAFAVTGGVSPSYVNVKVYEVRAAQNADCSGGITIYQTGAPAYQNWSSNPTIGSGALPNGTYNCLMIRMSDQIHYSPSTTDGSWTHGVCTVGTDYVLDVAHNDTGVDPDGTTHVFGSQGTDNTPWLYIRTGGRDSQDSSAWKPTEGLALTTPLVVSGDRSQTMVMDFTNQVSEVFDGGTWSCGCEAPTMGFR